MTASLITLVSRHNGSDALLNDLLKRDQALFGERAITPWTVKTQFREFCDRYQSEKIISSNGELILIKFRILLLDIVSRLLADIISYANEKISGEDILMPKFCINQDVATVRLLINTDGAAVSKSPPPPPYRHGHSF